MRCAALTAWLRVGLIGTALGGCYSSDGRDGPPPVIEELACDPRELALAWSSGDGEWASTYSPASIEVAPGGALLARGGMFGARITRMGDGEEIAPIGAAVMDRGWARSIEIDSEARVATVRAVASGALLATIELTALGEGWSSSATAVLSNDGEVAMLLECASEPATGATRTTVRAVPIAGGAEARVTIDLACGEPWGTPPSIRPLADGRAAIVTGLREPGPSFVGDRPAPVLGIARVDFDLGTAITAFPSDDTAVAIEGPSAHVGTPDLRLVHAALSDDLSGGTAELAIVARDGMLRRLDATTLEPIAEPIAVPLFIANHDTYLPSVESPVAYSSLGALLAHVDVGGAIVLRETSGGEIVARLELPFPARADGAIAPAMALRFVPDGILVSTSGGIARFACGGAVAEVARPSGELALRASGPSAVRIGEVVRFDVTVENATLPVVRWARMSEGSGVGASLGPAITTYSPSAGTFEVEIVVDDGTRTARTTATVSVSE